MAKSIKIKNDEVTALVEEVSAATGKGTTELILKLLRQEVEHRRRLSGVAKRWKRIDAILKRARRKTLKDAPPTANWIQFDADGLPR